MSIFLPFRHRQTFHDRFPFLLSFLFGPVSMVGPLPTYRWIRWKIVTHFGSSVDYRKNKLPHQPSCAGCVCVCSVEIVRAFVTASTKHRITPEEMEPLRRTLEDRNRQTHPHPTIAGNSCILRHVLGPRSF